MKKLYGTTLLVVGILVGLALSGHVASAAEDWIKAVRSTQPVYIDGVETEIEAYLIDGSNYVKLRDIADKTDAFNVYWDGTVQIESGTSYTGEAPQKSSEKKDPIVNMEKSKEIIIVDDDYVTATFEKMYHAPSYLGEGRFCIDITVKNKTSKIILVYLDNAFVNNELVTVGTFTGMTQYSPPEKSSQNTFGISFSDLSIDKVDDVKNISFDLVIVSTDIETSNEVERIKSVSLDF